MLECQHYHFIDNRWLDFCLSVVEAGLIEDKIDAGVKLALIMLCGNDRYGLDKLAMLGNYLRSQGHPFFGAVLSDLETQT